MNYKQIIFKCHAVIARWKCDRKCSYYLSLAEMSWLSWHVNDKMYIPRWESLSIFCTCYRFENMYGLFFISRKKFWWLSCLGRGRENKNSNFHIFFLEVQNNLYAFLQVAKFKKYKSCWATERANQREGQNNYYTEPDFGGPRICTSYTFSPVNLRHLCNQIWVVVEYMELSEISKKLFSFAKTQEMIPCERKVFTSSWFDDCVDDKSFEI